MEGLSFSRGGPRATLLLLLLLLSLTRGRKIPQTLETGKSNVSVSKVSKEVSCLATFEQCHVADLQSGKLLVRRG